MDFNTLLPTMKKHSHNMSVNNILLDWKMSPHEEVFAKSSHHNHQTYHSHQWFNTHLRLNEICDIDQIEVPGAHILLPWGQKLSEKLATLVRETAEESNYIEYSYPCLLPKKYFDPIKDLINISESLLNLDHEKNLVLSPTGECSIYHHWRSMIKTKTDLPKKIFQRAKYFRPMSSSKRGGGSAFLSMEASDIFEFHSCFGDTTLAMHEAAHLLSLFKKIAEKTNTSICWTLRPTWTNRGNLYQWSFGGDAILPSHYSIQVASSYYQGDIFSKRFNIAFREDGKKTYTSQATGAISRRLLFAHLFQYIRTDGSLCLHPNFSPIQITIFLINYNSADELIAYQLLKIMQGNNILAVIKKINSNRHLQQENKHWHRLGIPLKLFIFGRATKKNLRLVLIRNDTKQEYIIHVSGENLHQINDLVQLALLDIINLAKKHYDNTHQKKIVSCFQMSDIKEILDQHKVASFPLCIDSMCVASIESLKKGEVLGFFSNEDHPQSGKCIITNKETYAHALVSRRI